MNLKPPASTTGPVLTRVDPPRALLTTDLVLGLRPQLNGSIGRRHESIAYLLGFTSGNATLATTAVWPDATTSPGSFDVAPAAMAYVMRTAADTGLQVVGQLHTHPGDAYHSDGDVEGARIAYPGFISLVLPDYGKNLPSLEGMAAFIYRHESGFVELDPSQIVQVPARV